MLGGVRQLRTAFGRLRTTRAAEQTTLDELSFLSDAGLVLSSSLDPQRIIDMIGSLAVPRLGDAAVVFLRDSDAIRLGAVVHARPAAATLLREIVSDHPPRLTDNVPPGLVLRTGQTWYLPFVPDDLVRSIFPGEADYSRFRRMGIGPVMVVPMPGRGRVLGALALFRQSGAYSPVEITLAEHLARRGAAALDNAQLFRGVKESALTLQRSLLPGTPPAIDGIDVAMEYRPGTADDEVGGDLYDVIPLDGGRVGVAIGDVMGRGLRAAAVMGQLRAALRAYALVGWGPAELMARLDRVVDALPGLQLATCLYVVYDPATGEATMANAGHLPPLLVLPDEAPDYLVLDPGLPLGVGDGGGFSETTIRLPTGSAVVLFTDGLVESRRMPLSEGMDRLRLGLAGLVASDSAGTDAVPAPLDHRRTAFDRRLSAQRGSADQDRRPPGGERRRSSSVDSPHVEGLDVDRRPENSARALLERCLFAAGRAAQTDDDTALLVLSTYPLRPPILEIALPAVASSASVARHAVTRALADRGFAPVPDDAELLVSEIVTNAVLHARSELVLRVTFDLGRRLRISVEDYEGGTLPRRAPPQLDAESGWGLQLVDALAKAWGVETTPIGKRVWFDLDVPVAARRA